MTSREQKIYHITRQATWEKATAKGVYDFDSLATEGFIHCSTESQYLEVANRIFSGSTDLLLLSIQIDKLVEKVIFENLEGGSEQYPHIYGPLNLDAVTQVTPLVANDNGVFC